MKRQRAPDWDLANRYAARTARAALLRALPRDWRAVAEAATDEGAMVQDGAPVWMRSGAWRDAVVRYVELHRDAARWCMGDADLRDLAQRSAAAVSELLAALGGLGVPDHVIARSVAGRAGCGESMPKPGGHVTQSGIVARALSADWWLRALRKKAARVSESLAIKLGIVSARRQRYASDYAVERRAQQRARNERVLSRSLLKNEAGQVYSLRKLSSLSVANPELRRGELMTRIRGCEEVADELGHVGYFLTLTCPSRFHPRTTAGRRDVVNPAYSDATPRDAQRWLRDTWARVRAQWHREGIRAYGLRVAEPHADSCPHWHAMLWFHDEGQAQRALKAAREHWLSDAGAEPGAKRHRFGAKRITSGGAAGYVAKYIAKNVDGAHIVEHVEDGSAQEATAAARRVDAWASMWGIRQFQAVGMPSVTAWRLLRAVSADQAEEARQRWGEAGRAAWHAWSAARKCGSLQADFGRYIKAMSAGLVTVATRAVEAVNEYGEGVVRKVPVGLALASGLWLVAKRQLWQRVEGVQPDEGARAQPAPWSGFNNCTGRLVGRLRAALMGREFEPVEPVRRVVGLI